MANEIAPIERGLGYYFERQKEFERKQIPVEKQVAMAYADGIEAGKVEIKSSIAFIFKPEAKDHHQSQRAWI